MKTGDIWQSRYNGEDFIKIEAMSRSGKSVRTFACHRNGRTVGGRIWTKRRSTVERDYRRYFSTDSVYDSALSTDHPK
jgi:hypothetical protein